MSEYPIRKRLLTEQNVVDRAALRAAGGYTIHDAARGPRRAWRVLGLITLLIVALGAALTLATLMQAVFGR